MKSHTPGPGDPRASAITVLAGTILCTLGTAQWSIPEGRPIPHPKDHLVQRFPAAEWEASNYAAEGDLQWFRDARFGMFIHFGLSTRIDRELSWGTCKTRKPPDHGAGPIADDVWQAWPDEFVFDEFDAEGLVALARRSGFRYLVAIAKHHEGFHLWDTAVSEFKVTNTPFGRDYLKELADACHEAELPFGIYYSQRDWYHPDYMPVDPAKVTRDRVWWTLKDGETSPLGDRHSKYVDYQFAAVRELCTNYGKVDVFWWDACWWGGMFTAEMWDSERLTRMVRELQPGIIQNNRCSVPGDFDTPEQRLGSFQHWRPWESCICLTSSWSHSGTPPKPLHTLLGMIIKNACGDGNVLLSWGPRWDGSFEEAEKQRLLEVGAWLEQNGTAIYETRGGPWKPAAWGGSTRRGASAFLHVLAWPEGALRLPGLPDRTPVTARLLDGTAVDLTVRDGLVTVQVPPARRDAFDTIVEVVFDRPLDDVPAIEATAR